MRDIVLVLILASVLVGALTLGAPFATKRDNCHGLEITLLRNHQIAGNARPHDFLVVRNPANGVEKLMHAPECDCRKDSP